MKGLTALTLLALLTVSSSDLFAGRALTVHLDGAQVEQREAARKGYLEITLPAGAVKESLRISPEKGAEILKVATMPLKPAKSVEKELAQLAEREELLHDRLKALSVREEIFKSAAKSQSAKAPRRTKTNPEPLSTIKQGTDYAITQLETVYHAKRKAEKELAQIAERRSRLSREELSGGTVARVWVSPASGRVTASWSQSDRTWSPLYQIRVDDKDSAVISMSAQGVALARGETAELVPAQLHSGGNLQKYRYENEWTQLNRADFKVSNLQESSSFSLKMSFTNSSLFNMPSGEISCFKNGVYMGKGRFKGADAGKQAEVVCGDR